MNFTFDHNNISDIKKIEEAIEYLDDYLHAAINESNEELDKLKQECPWIIRTLMDIIQANILKNYTGGD